MAMEPIVRLLTIEQKPFLFVGISPVSGTFGPTNKKLLLWALCDSGKPG
jgi:hypothetical protein